jgi:hypothetical protein
MKLRDNKVHTKARSKTFPLKNAPTSPSQTINSPLENSLLIRLKKNTKIMKNLQTDLNKTTKAPSLAVILINSKTNGIKMKNPKFLPPKCSGILSPAPQFFKVEVLESSPVNQSKSNL